MLITVHADDLTLSPEDRARLARALRRVLEPFQPRVARATLRVRGGPGGRAAARVTVPLGPAGAVRAEVRGRGPVAVAEAVAVRAAEAVQRRLAAERAQLLAFLFLATGEPGAWPSPPPPRARRRPDRAPSRPASAPARALGPRRDPPLAA